MNMRTIKLLGLALMTTLALSAMAASTASAFHPLFLTESKKELLFFGVGGLPAHLVGGLPTLRALNLGVLGTITCELILIHGFVLDKSTLAHRIKIEFEHNCTTTIGSTKSACEEPFVWKELLGELGLVLLNKTVGFLLAPSDGTSVFAKPNCGSVVTTILGAVIGEIPLLSADPGRASIDQYNKLLSLTEVVFESEKQNENQNITHIELLGVLMEGVKLDVEGFFGGPASEEARAFLHSDGKIEICTRADGIGCE
jgi:hypothetical protein